MSVSGQQPKSHFFRRVRRIGISPEMTPSLKRQISLTNQLCVLAILLTTPYQLFYLVADPAYYWPVLLANGVFTALYGVPIWLNHLHWHTPASDSAFVIGCGHILLVTMLVSTATGTHLILISLGGVLGLMFRKRRQGPLLLMALVCVVLFVIAELFYQPGSTWIVIPSPWVEIMFFGTVLAAVTLLTGFSYTFRRAIERSETSQRKTALELERLSLTDELTRLPNRRALDQLMASEWGRAVRYKQSIGLLMIDIDYFKAFNDHYGHSAGDDCLCAVARVLESSLQRDADQVARYGGEEFFILLPDTDIIGARSVASRVLAGMEALAWPHSFSAVADYVTVSIGIAAQYPSVTDRSEVLINRADKALYQAKDEGRARVAEYT